MIQDIVCNRTWPNDRSVRDIVKQMEHVSMLYQWPVGFWLGHLLGKNMFFCFYPPPLVLLFLVGFLLNRPPWLPSICRRSSMQCMQVLYVASFVKYIHWNTTLCESCAIIWWLAAGYRLPLFGFGSIHHNLEPFNTSDLHLETERFEASIIGYG